MLSQPTAGAGGGGAPQTAAIIPVRAGPGRRPAHARLGRPRSARDAPRRRRRRIWRAIRSQPGDRRPPPLAAADRGSETARDTFLRHAASPLVWTRSTFDSEIFHGFMEAAEKIFRVASGLSGPGGRRARGPPEGGEGAWAGPGRSRPGPCLQAGCTARNRPTVRYGQVTSALRWHPPPKRSVTARICTRGSRRQRTSTCAWPRGGPGFGA